MPSLMFESSMRNHGLPQWRGLYAAGREVDGPHAEHRVRGAAQAHHR
jgi:hypothetical protein